MKKKFKEWLKKSDPEGITNEDFLVMIIVTPLIAFIYYSILYYLVNR